jgi:hypothetical protein
MYVNSSGVVSFIRGVAPFLSLGRQLHFPASIPLDPFKKVDVQNGIIQEFDFGSECAVCIEC